MEKRGISRPEPIPSILKKPKSRRKGDLLDKKLKIKRDTGKSATGDATLPQGCTALMYACQQADYKTVVDVLNKDPSTVGARDRGLRCALHYCASSGAGANAAARAACADRVLMAEPVLANARDSDGLTPLHLAVVHGNVPLVQTLLAAGADVNATDDEHHTVVHWATVCGEVGALRAVLAGGADAATPDQHGGYPLHYAAQMCGAPAATDHQSRGAALEVLRALIREGGAEVSVRDADGRTPLLWASSAGSAAAVLALHQVGAAVDDADRDGLTALHCAAARGHTEALETLVGLCGARVDAADSHGCTPLHYAAALGHADATAALLQHGADSHRQDRRGRSPAHTAAAKGQLETVRMLGARGANLWLRNSKGDLPLHEAVASGRRELVKWLLDGRPSQVNATNHEGRTPLHVAAATDNADLCRLLLDRGAEVNLVARSSKNEPITPLDCATSRGHRSTAKYLQMHGGLPASKLMNTQIVIDGAPITALPTRKVTSTKIDVRDRIRIEKREVVEVSSPIPDRRHIRRRSGSSSGESSSMDKKSYKKESRNERRKRLVESQRSFSDGYDSEIHRVNRDISDGQTRRHTKSSKKGRSKSEPYSKRRDDYNSPRRQRRHRSSSSNSEGSRNYSGKKKHKRHRRRSKRQTSTSSESSSSESSDRRNTKRKGKKTSIHIENDEETQRVNIVNFKGSEKVQSSTKNEEGQLTTKGESVPLLNDDGNTKSRNQSETETDTISLKTNMVITEAQVHVERESSQQGPSEITVTVDSSNNVSIEAANMSIVHKEIKDTLQIDKIEANSVQEKTESDGPPIKDDNAGVESSKDDNTSTIDQKVELQITDSNEQIEKSDTKSVSNEVPTNLQKTPEGESLSNEISSTNQVRKRSFQILSGPGETLTEIKKSEDGVDKTPTVSFANKDDIFESKDSEKSCDTLMGEHVVHDEQKNNDEEKNKSSASEKLSSEDKRKEYTSTTASSTELVQSSDKDLVDSHKGIITVLSEKPPSDRAVQQVIMETDTMELQLAQSSPVRQRKSSKDSQGSSRKSSIYETESYKVLSDIASATETAPGILKKMSKTVASLDDDKDTTTNKSVKDNSYGRIPSVSDNELYSHSEVNGRRKKLRKKTRAKSRTTFRSKSENSERGYESSGMMDSGFEPSPRFVQKRIMSPRLAAYYQQRKASGRHSGKSDSRIPVRKPGDKYAVDMKSVTQRVQTNMRRYYCERKIFQHLLELKRLQIRTSKTNEAVLVKRAIDEYNKSSLANVGMGPYNNPDLSFSTFEKFLYESLRKLQKSGKKHLDNLPEKPIDFDYGESELYKMSSIPDNPCLCTSKTHRCFHAVHAYTGIPCSAYIPYKWNHHTMPKPSTAGGSTKSKGFLPKIDAKPPTGSKAHVTLEVSHGNEKQLIALPAEKLDKNKRYYVTFTVKGSEPPSDNDNVSPNGTPNVKSVRSG